MSGAKTSGGAGAGAGPQGIAPARIAPLPETTEGNPWFSTQEIKKESNPFTERDWRMWIYAWSGLLVRIALILGAVFSVYQFLAAREEQRVQRTLDLVELWEKPEYQAAQQAVKNRVDELNAKNANLLGTQPSSNERAVYLRRLGIAAMKDDGSTMKPPEFDQNFSRIVYFLNRVSVCVKGGLCSAEVADIYFRDYAVSFWDYFSGYVAERRKTVPSYAQPLENYVLGDPKPQASQ